MDQRDTNPGGYIPPQPAPPKKSNKKGCGCLASAAVFIVIVVAIAVAEGGGSNNTASNGTNTTDTTTAAAPDTQAATASDGTNIVDTGGAVAPAVPATTVAAQVTYACTGSAPDGVDITYGPSGSNYSASKLPFTKTVALDDSAEYYVTEAQLSGSGQVTCTTTVRTSDGTQTVNTGTASGGYNIASAQICSSFDGGWDKC